MLPFTQRNRIAAIATPLGEDALGLVAFNGHEMMSQPFEYTAQVVSRDANLDFDKLIGAPVTVRLDTLRGGRRTFSGIVSRLEQVASQKHYARYQLTIVPWLWFLTRCSDCRIYQDRTVPEIIEDLFRRHQLGEFEMRLTGKYAAKEYCVQYRESDFNFVSRLMEQEGIYYYFLHNKGKHVLVVADSPGAHESRKGYEDMLYRPGEASQRDLEQIMGWTIRREARTGGFECRDFDFKAPTKDLTTQALVRRKHGISQCEYFDYPGGYSARDEGRQYAKVRLQELQVRHSQVMGDADARGLATGHVFKLREHPRKDQCGKHLILGTQITLRVGEYESEDGTDQEQGPFFHCAFTAMDAEEQYRPERCTPKPVVQGLQTAIVVGPANKEVHVDRFARVRLHFHWDRHKPATAEDSSCWVRVCQPWAGKGFGGMAVPRIGQEVIVDFLEGDPDQPVVNGRVYNAGTMPHLSRAGNDKKHKPKKPAVKPLKPCPAEKPPEKGQVQEVSDSVVIGGGQPHGGPMPGLLTPGPEVKPLIGAPAGTMAAVVRSERTFVASEGPKVSKVLGPPDEKVSMPSSFEDVVWQTGLRSSSEGGGGYNELVMNDKKGEETFYLKAQKDHISAVGADRHTSVGSNSMEDIAADRTTSVGGDSAETIGGDRVTEVGGNSQESIGANRSTEVASNSQENVGSNLSLEVGANASEKVGAAKVIDVGSTLMIKAGTSITLQCGASTIHMNQAGFITISGTVISTAAAVNASVVAPLTEIVGAAMLAEAGGLIKIFGGVTHVGAAGMTKVSGATVFSEAKGDHVTSGAKVASAAKGENIIQGASVKLN
ncbi:MAG: type VI secretion system tip protein VgrG [Verrucomicrobiales bacterium]|nr:type VI secretion system tip protein VgrG [Verrucomicrobiales bacterium]